MKNEKKWYALLTRSHFENTVHSAISRKSIETFLPIIKKQSRRKDRRIIIDAPLFPGYLFVNISEAPEEQLMVLKTIGAVRILGYNNRPVEIPKAQIDSLKIITEHDANIVTGTDKSLKQGEMVLVTQGIFTGLQGEFIRYKGKDRVIIKIETMGQFAGVEISKEDIEKLPRHYSITP